MPTAKRINVLIVGGGFGGIKAALALSTNENFRVTLLTDRPNFRFYPTLYHTATGGAAKQSSIPLSTIFQDKPIEIIIGTATKLQRKNKTIHTSEGKIIHYEKLLLALGVITNYFGIKGLSEYAFGIKSLEEAERLKSHLHQQLTDNKAPDLNYVIVGGGPTGIELAGQLPLYIKQIMARHNITNKAVHIDLVEAAPKLLPRLPKDAQRSISNRLRHLGIRLYLGQTVQAETADTLVINGKPITSHTVIWTAGVTNHPFFKDNGFALTDRGKVEINEYLEAEPNIYVLGDNANTPFSGMAQTALYDALFVTYNLKWQVKGGLPYTYKPHQPITIIPAGPHWAAVIAGRIRLYGWVGWALREAADFIGFRDVEPFWKAYDQWLSEFDSEESCPVCSLRT